MQSDGLAAELFYPIKRIVADFLFDLNLEKVFQDESDIGCVVLRCQM